MAAQLESDPQGVFRGQSVEWLEAFKVKLWRYLTLHLDDVGVVALQIYDELGVLLAMVNAQQSPPDAVLAQMKEALGSALARFPSAPSFDLKKSGPGGTRTHDPHNAEAESGMSLGV